MKLLPLTILLTISNIIQFQLNKRRQRKARIQARARGQAHFLAHYSKLIESKNISIPKNVYQTYKRPIPSVIQESMSILQKQNKNFKFYFFDDEMCQNFIKEHFDKNVLNAYNILIPGAYKADLWRYCVMYIKGGIYIDCKYIMNENYTLDSLLNSEYYVRDVNAILRYNEEYIYQALLVSKPKNRLFLKCINKIVDNVNSRNICRCDLDVTGPRLFSDQLRENMNYLVERGKFNVKDLKHTGCGNVFYKDNLYLKVHKRDKYYLEINKNNRYGKIYPNIYKTCETD